MSSCRLFPICTQRCSQVCCCDFRWLESFEIIHDVDPLDTECAVKHHRSRMVQQQQAIEEKENLRRRLVDRHDDGACARHTTEYFHNRQGCFAGQPARRLITEQDRWVRSQFNRDGQKLELTRAETRILHVADTPIRKSNQFHLLHYASYVSLTHSVGHFCGQAQTCREKERLINRRSGQMDVLLGAEADHPTVLRSELSDVNAVDQDLACPTTLDRATREHIQKSRLRNRGAQQSVTVSQLLRCPTLSILCYQKTDLSSA